LKIARIIVAVLAAGAAAVSAAEVKLAIAANFTKPMQALAPVYEKLTGDRLVMSFGATGALYAQIKNGAPFDILLAADNKASRKAVKEGYGVEGTPFVYAVGKLVLWSSDPDLIRDETSLESDRIRKLALADPKLAPYGLAAQETLEKLGKYEKLSPKFVMGGNISKTYQFVSTGNAQAGFIALSQCYKDGKLTGGSAWIVPESFHSPILQEGVLLKAGEHPEAARKFIEFLANSPEADSVRTAFGYAKAH